MADPVLASATQPSVSVKVIDKRNKAIYVWSLDRLQQQLQRMRNLTSFIDRPSYSQHFSTEEPFYNSPPPEYSFVGNALVSLAPLSRKLSSTSIVPIFCRYTSEAIGSCRVDVRVAPPPNLPLKSPPGSIPSTRSASPMPGTRAAGSSKLGFFVTIDSIKGLSSVEFSALHTQIRLSSFTGPRVNVKTGQSNAASEEVYTSTSLDMDKSPLSDLKFRKAFTVPLTPKVTSYLRDGYAPIEFFATIKPTYLERLERWDELREQRHAPKPSPNSDSGSNLQVMRRSETDFVVEQIHDVVSWVQVTELSANGSYVPLPVVTQGYLDPGSFSLHQGLQRRLVLTLVSNSGRQLPWMQVSRVKLGNVRLLDAKGRVHESVSPDLVDLKLLKQQQTVEYKPDGTGSLTAEALWDSGAHDSLLLNRITPSGQRVLLQVMWYVEIETCGEPVPFTMDIAVSVTSRDARPPTNFLTFLGTSKVLTKTSTVFSLRLTPPLTRSAKDLWRLDTSEKYVRGEAALGSWKPRGISVVEDYVRLDTREKRSADVQAVKALLSSSNPAPRKPIEESKEETLLRKSLDLWQRRLGHRGEVSGSLLEYEYKLTAILIDYTQTRAFRTFILCLIR